MSYKLVSPLPIIEGGTGVKLTTPYAVICGGTTNTGPLQFIASVGTSGQVLTSNGAGSLPTFQTSGGSDQFDTDSGTATPSSGVINILADTNAGSSVSFSGSGNTVLFNVTDNKNNTIVGLGAGNNSLTGNYNTAFGLNALNNLTTGSNNVGVGFTAGQSITSGSSNVLVGLQSGLSYTSSESSNICIGNGSTGVTGESNVLRIGNGTGMSAGNLNQAFIYGIDAVNVGSTANVVTEVGNQLGTAVITAGSGITITPGANTITIAASGGGSGLTSIAGDDAAMQTGPAISLVANATAGSSVSFTGLTNTISLNITDINGNTIIGLGAGNLTLSGSGNTGLGSSAASSLSSGVNNSMVGSNAGLSLNTGSSNILIGEGCGISLASGSTNTIIGTESGNSLLSGSSNVAIGYQSGNQYSSSESNNILLNSSGTTGESNILRIGSDTGTGTGQLNKAFICGIAGVNVGSVATIVTEASDQLGTAVLTAGTGITITPTANVITISATGGSGLTSITGDTGGAQTGPAISLVANATAGSSVSFSGSSNTISLNVTDANRNTLIGKSSGIAGITGQFNIGLGAFTGASLTSGASNVCIGDSAGILLTSAHRNTLVGGSAGFNYTVETDNIILGSSIFGMVGESNVLRIGASTGPGGGQLLQSFIAGIYGISVATADGIPVYVGSGDQLGTIASTKRVKHSIEDMNDTSSAILNLRPVTFVYNGDTTEKKQYGLIAEEVNEIFPGLVACNKNGEIETVLYHVLPAMLLNEIKKLNARITDLEAKL